MRKAHKEELKKSLVQLRLLKRDIDRVIDMAEEKSLSTKKLDDVYFSLLSVEEAITHLRRATT